LEHYEDLLGYKSDAYDTVILCVAVLMLCLSPAKRTHSFQQRPYQERSFCIPIGRKAARLYPIPSVALYGTRRGATLCTQYHTNGLYDIEKGIKGCPFWDEALREYQRHGKWVSDDAMEAFYDRYFPDDIPDEWSQQDQLISHGQGVLRTGERLSLAKLGRIWFQAESRYAWGFYEWTGIDRPGIDRPGTSRLDFQMIADNLNVPDDTLVVALLEPVRKLLIVE
jgi:hypothetical protein